MKKLISGIMLLTLFAAGYTALNAADLSEKINFQGQLTNASGSPVTGTLSMTFNVYNSLTGGTALKTIQNTSVSLDDNGLYNVELDVSGIDLSQNLWLGIVVGSDTEMTPRAPILPSASSLYSLSAKNSTQLGGNDSSSYLLKSGGSMSGQLDVNNYAILSSSSIVGVREIKWADGSVSTHAASMSGSGSYLELSGGTMTGPITSSQSRLQISTNVYVVGYSSASAYYGDGSTLSMGRSYGEMYATGNTNATTIAVAGTYVKVNITTSDGILKNFTNSGSNRLTYTGTKSGVFLCTVNCSAKITVATREAIFKIFKNGSALSNSAISQRIATANADYSITLSSLVNLSTGNYLELYITEDSTNDITVTELEFNVVEID